MTSSYDGLQVALSVLIAVAASYAALDLAGRVTAAHGRRRIVWLTGGSLSMGLGIWAMHYVGMLAFRLPVPVNYHVPTVLLSLSVGILYSVFALLLVSREGIGRFYVVAGGIILGCGIAGLHYIGMAAMRLQASCRFNPFVVTLSVLLAIVFSLIALWLAFYFRGEPKKMVWRKVGSAAIMGGAISAMHYTGMAAATFFPSASPPNFLHTVSISSLGTFAICLVTLIVLAVAILSSAVGRYYDEQSLKLALTQAKLELAHVSRVATLGELAASIAHEINQPLSSIAMSASASLHWLEMQPPNLAEARQAMEKAIREVNRASEIIGRIRAFLKRRPAETAIVSVNEIVGDVLSFVGRELANAGVIAKTELAPDAAVVRGDRVQLQQVLLNLVMNAIEAMSTTNHAPRELIIRSANQGNRVLVQVEDSGPGLDPAQLDRVFEAFFTTKPQGLGMGLSISRSIVEAHGGHLTIKRRDTHGAIFEFTLPAPSGAK